MLHNSPNRICSLPALLAATVFVFWPSLVRGDCCCETNLAKVVATQASPVCCQSNSTASRSESKSCCIPNDDLCSDDHDANSDCERGASCCLGLIPVSQSRTITTEQIRPLDGRFASTSIEFPSGVQVRSSDPPDDPPYFLRAQDRCAQICRWLK